MDAERLAAMPWFAISLDLETDLIPPGLKAPPMVLGSAADTNPIGLDANEAPFGAPLAKINLFGKLLGKRDVRELVRMLLDDPRYTLCFANGPFDLLVLAVDAAMHGVDLMPKIFDLFDPERTIVRGYCKGRVFDVCRAEELHAIAGGHLFKDPLTKKGLINYATGRSCRYNLDKVTELVQNRLDAKTNARFRSGYHQFHDWPLEKLPYEAAKYPVDDAINTVGNALAQAGHLPSVNIHQWVTGQHGAMGCQACGIPMTPDAPQACMVKRARRNLHDLARQCYAAWALNLSDAWGFHIDQESVDALEHKYCDTRVADAQPFVDAGMIRADGTENQAVQKKLVAYAYGARTFCQACVGTVDKKNQPAPGKVPSPKTEGKTLINCEACDGTGYELIPEVPRAEKGGVKLDRDTMQESGDELLMAKGLYDENDRIITTMIPLMRRGRVCVECGQHGTKKFPHRETCSRFAPVDPIVALHAGDLWRDVPLNPETNPLVESGRISVRDGLHSLPRKGGVRECFQARKGMVYSSEDYSGGELVMHAQNCLWVVGYSRLAEALNAGLDAHLALAGTMAGKPYAEMARLKKLKDALVDLLRQAAKNANFGFMGGMAEMTFVLKKRSEPGLFTPCPNGPDVNDDETSGDYGVRGYKGFRPCIVLDGNTHCGVVKVTNYKKKACPPVCLRCLEAAKRLREFWFTQWPENNQKDGYFAKINEILESSGGEIVQHQSNRVRGDVGFCDGANGLFQSMLADAMKNAYCQIQRECYDRTVRIQNSEHMTSLYAGGESPLYGSRGEMVAHDEFLGEHPESVAAEAATRVAEIMIEAERFMAPQLSKACVVKPTLMRRLYKGAEPVYHLNGIIVPEGTPGSRLGVWEPKKKVAA